jgi:hypothetical protein
MGVTQTGRLCWDRGRLARPAPQAGDRLGLATLEHPSEGQEHAKRGAGETPAVPGK